MTLDEASKITMLWGIHLEHVFGKLNVAFMGHIPESFLPFSKQTLEEAVNIMAEYHFNNDNQPGSKTLQAGLSNLIFYKGDEEAISKVVEFWSVPSCRATMLPSLKAFQKTWQKIAGH